MTNNTERTFLPQINIKGARIIYRNFQGGPSIDRKSGRDYNRDGSRYFSILLDPEMAKDFEARGMNVKWPHTKEGQLDTERDPWVQIKVSVGREVRPFVRLYLVDGDHVERLNNASDSQMKLLDDMWMDRELGSNLVLNQNEWTDDNGLKRISLYLAIGYFRKAQNSGSFEDPFAEEFGTQGL